jgi:hypothetical protein
MVFKPNSCIWVLFWQMYQKMKEYHDHNTCHQTDIKLVNHWIQIFFPQKCLLYCIYSLNVSKEHVCVDWDVKKTHKMKVHKWPTNVILIVIYAALIFVVPLVHFSFTTQNCKIWPNLNYKKGGKLAIQICMIIVRIQIPKWHYVQICSKEPKFMLKVVKDL